MPTRLLEQSLVTAAAELKYESSTHLVEIISKDEDIRRLRFDTTILQDDNDELRGLLEQETERSNAFEKLINENMVRAEEAEARLQDLQLELRSRDQELSTLQAERSGLQNITQDATAAVAEKLALARELSTLKPELEHLKTQVLTTEALVTDKLALQRQLTEIQCELENAKREVKRALAKRRNTGVEIAQEEQMDDLRRQLAKEKRARERAEEAQVSTSDDADVEQLRRELLREKCSRQKVEERLEEALNATQVEEVRTDLLKEKKAKDKLQQTINDLRAELDDEKTREHSTVVSASLSAETASRVEELENEVEALKEELSSEKKKASKTAKKSESAEEDKNFELQEKLTGEKQERMRLEKLLKDTVFECENQKSALEDKLDQFRNKLRSTKETLKAAEAELGQIREASASVAPSKTPGALPKTTRKRHVAQINADETTLGTPGNGHTVKRGRKAFVPTAGDKSTFSITPFLNRTANAARDSADEDDAENDMSPTIKQKPRPLTLKSASESNARKPRRANELTLKQNSEVVSEMVTEDHGDTWRGDKADAAVDIGTKTVQEVSTIPTKTGDEPSKPLGKKSKLRKSIHDFATFTAEPEIKKRRKLGGVAKTLFDDDDDDGGGGLSVKALPAKGLFGSRGLGLSAKKGGLFGSRLAAHDPGSAFSPLKRTRKNLDDTLRV